MSAESLREKINSENEIKLREQRLRAAQNSRPQTSSQGQSANIKGNRNTSSVNQQPRLAAPQNTRLPQTRENRNMANPSQSAAPVRQNSQGSIRPVGGTQSQNRAVSQNQTAAARNVNPNRPVSKQSQPAVRNPQVQKTSPQSEQQIERRSLYENRPQSDRAERVYNAESARKAAKVSEKKERAKKKALDKKLTAKKAEEKKAKKKAQVSHSTGAGGNTVLSIVKAIVYIIFIMIVSVFCSIMIINVSNDVFAFVKDDSEVKVTIPEYATLDEVANILYDNGVIKYPKIFKLYAVARSDDAEYVAGEYTITPNLSYDYLLSEFKVKPVTGWQEITIPEGYTTDDMINLFISKGIGTREGFVEAINNYEFDYWFIDELGENWADDGRIYRLDGYLFPDTYQFYNNSSEVTVIKKMLVRFAQIFTKEYRQQCAEMGYSVDEMITLASMIEKEAASASEFFTVSSVFHNRLKNPWSFPRLESDATIVYAIAHDEGERRQITSSDLYYDTPYNSYLNDGLPPGPICNPSASAMLAALSPTETNYYYFVSDNGVTYFSETKAQHDEYIAQIRAANEALQNAAANNETASEPIENTEAVSGADE